jgi:hypothetical protein
VSHSTISLGLGLGGGKSATSNGAPGGGGFSNALSLSYDTGTGANADSMAFDGTANTGIARFTMSCWVNHSATQDGIIFGVFGSSIQEGPFIYGFGHTAYYFYCSPGGGYVKFNGGGPQLLNQWVHLVAVNNNGAGKFYINGVLRGEKASGLAINLNSAWKNGAIGGTPLYSSYSGLLDEPSIFDVALTDGGVSVGDTATGEIATLYNGGVPGDISDLRGDGTLIPTYWYRNGDDAGDETPTGGTPASGESAAILSNLGSFNKGLPAGDATQGAATPRPTFSSSVPS